MPWIKFKEPFDWKPKPAVTVAYQSGQVLNVTTACANAAVALGKAVRMKKASKTADPVEDEGQSEV